MENFGIQYNARRKSVFGYAVSPAKIDFGFKT
jgi:hypothetical protein